MKVVARRALVIPALFLTIGINGLAQDKTWRRTIRALASNPA